MIRRRSFRLTIRGRLTLIYGGLFLVAGLFLLGLTYLLVAQTPTGPHSGQLVIQGGPSASPASVGRTAPLDPIPQTGAPTPVDSGNTEVYGSTLLAQVNDEAQARTLHALLTQGGVALGLVGVVAVASGWLVAGRMLRPLHRMTETARRIADTPAADHGLHERIALTGPRDELKDLADTFDMMLERIDHSFDGQRRFIANASHELRTPLALNRTLLEVALEPAAAPPEVRQLGTTLLAINARHARLIDGLLLLARSEPAVTERSYVDLADIVDHVATLTPAGTVTVRTEPGEAATNGNPVLLERLVDNLVENGVRYNVPVDGWVHVSTGTRPDGTVTLRVSNSGPVVPKYEVPGLFEPFHRLGTDRLAGTGGGAGLGLSIVRAVATAHDGEVHAEARPGGGLTVTVTLPGA